MSESQQQDSQETRPPVTDPASVTEPAGSPGTGADPATSPLAPEADESTVGTGTSIALGCIAGTVILIVIGLIVIGIIALVS